tara:strand:+ start:234 stop:506 length:273 start_codon:yes stop_codon:yes gene_type:complete
MSSAIKRNVCLEEDTCFNILEKLSSSELCNNSACEFNSCSMSKSCAIVALIENKTGRLTLQEVGDMFSLSRMRVCQIEKKIVKKLIDDIM